MIEQEQQTFKKVFEEQFEGNGKFNKYSEFENEAQENAKKRLKELYLEVDLEETYKEYNTNYEIIKKIQDLMLDIESNTHIVIFKTIYERSQIFISFELQKRQFMFDKKLSTLNYKANNRNRFTIFEATSKNNNTQVNVEYLEEELNDILTKYIKQVRKIISHLEEE